LPLLDIPVNLDTQHHPRNRCINEGFRSVAMVPIRETHEIVGLLQLNSRKKDYFTLDLIQFFEGICSSIGAAMERKRAEDALRESEEKFRTHVENAFDVIFTLDREGTTLFISPAWERLLGYSADRIIGKSFASYIHPDDIRACLETITQVLRTGQSETSTPYRIQHADGSWRWFEANGTRYVNANGDVQVIGVGRDITERKRMNDVLRESEEKFRNYVDHSFDIIFTLDDNGIFLFVSSVFGQHFGYPASDVTGKLYSNIVHPDDIPICEAILKRILKTGQGEMSAPYRVKHADGGWRWLEANVTRFVNANGQGEYLGIARDISERKAAEEQLLNYAAALESNNKSLEELNRLSEAATRAKSEFLANMSHEIRTPMTAILGCADLLIGEKGLEKAPPQRRKNIETIKRNGEHLLGLINDILDLSKIEAGKMKIGSTRCSPFELIGDVVSLMQVRAEAKQLRFETDLADPLPETVLTDPLRLRQVLINLVGNAIKFTDHGKICIAARLSDDNGRPRLRFDVTDTGIGMNEEQVGKLFRAFSQVDSSAVRKFSGTGLGLCIGKRLAEAMVAISKCNPCPARGALLVLRSIRDHWRE
jgi:PAS domain S-box-containing protein